MITLGAAYRRIFAETLFSPSLELSFTTSSAPGTLSCNLAVPLKGTIFGELHSSVCHLEREKEGRRLNGYLGLSLNYRTILFLVILLDKTVSVG